MLGGRWLVDYECGDDTIVREIVAGRPIATPMGDGLLATVLPGWDEVTQVVLAPRWADQPEGYEAAYIFGTATPIDGDARTNGVLAWSMLFRSREDAVCFASTGRLPD